MCLCGQARNREEENADDEIYFFFWGGAVREVAGHRGVFWGVSLFKLQ